MDIPMIESLPKLQRLPHPSPVAEDVRAGLIADPGFGKVFTDQGDVYAKDCKL